MKQFMQGERNVPIGRSIDRMLANCGPIQTQSIEEPFLLEKTQSLRRPNETILAFCGRIGLGPRELREWKLNRIADFVAAAERNNADSEPEPHVIVSEKPTSQPGVVYK